MITVALDKSADDARPWIEKAQPAHPSLVDTRHVLADLYNVVNVPTIFWIDERGRIVRPNDVAFGTDTFKHITGLESARHLTALRAWVRGETPALSADDVKRHQPLPTAADRGRRLASLEAPDFTLPDLDGRPHSLSDHRGAKVFLVAYGSW